MTQTIRSSSNVRLRPATTADQAQLSQLFHQTRNFIHEYLDAEYDYKQSLIEQQESFRTIGYQNQYPNALDFVIEHQNTFVGRVTLDFSAERIHLIDIALIKDAQGKGFGEAVIKDIQAAASSSGAPVSLSLSIENIYAYKLYRKMGFITESQHGAFQRMTWHPAHHNSSVFM